MQFPAKLKEKIEKRKKQGKLITLINHDELIDFYSNDYFGVSEIPHVAHDLKAGATGSRLISGNYEYLEALEDYFSAFFGYEAGLVFASGFDANVGIYSSILHKGDLVITDSLIHISIKDGIRLSYAKSYSFKHNDLESLERKLQLGNPDGDIFVVVESVYSMDGVIAPLAEISEICKKYGAYLIVDEAHSGGIIGHKGKGLTHELNIDKDVFLKLVTFGKAYGSTGAVVLCSKELRQYLINFCTPFIYTTGMSELHADRMRQAFEIVSEMNEERKLLRDNINYFKSVARTKNINLIDSPTGIQPIIIPDLKDLIAKVNELVEAGYAVRPIVAPTVPLGLERIRICIHSFNTKEEIDGLLSHF
ncbi:MAG: pyridoxal phosphate-dependent aminotransferase family protein [Putridiphycobacter sp.]|jgi:8-amino-7-oxononanoate synthase|nr:pyridoxal phosphate-dependent aminotransferase family protein [Putridiphycobacter sp.]